MPQIFEPENAVRWEWIGMEGPDAADFLHRLSTVNVKTLAEGAGAEGFLLDPQGRIKAWFNLWRLGQGAFGFEFDGGAEGRWGKALLEQIERFTFSEKFTLTPEKTKRCLWILDDGMGVPERSTVEREGVRLCNHGASRFGRPWVTAWGEPAALERFAKSLDAGPARADLAQLERQRIAQLQPSVDREVTESANPLELGRAISENKGCYPGQEVIEKIISLGAPAKRLCLLSGNGPPPAPGEATSLALEPNGNFRALAILRKTEAKEKAVIRFASGSEAIVEKISDYR